MPRVRYYDKGLVLRQYVLNFTLLTPLGNGGIRTPFMNIALLMWGIRFTFHDNSMKWLVAHSWESHQHQFQPFRFIETLLKTYHLSFERTKGFYEVRGYKTSVQIC